MILDAAPPDLGITTAIDLGRLPLVLADRRLSSGRHLVLGDSDGPHRLWLRAHLIDQPVAYVIARDASFELRLAAVRRLDRRLAGAPPGRLPPGFSPTPFQRHRLSLLLDILDLASPDEGAGAATYDIARAVIYPHMKLSRGRDWKSSAERRRTRRLIDEAFSLRDGGYRALLRD